LARRRDRLRGRSRRRGPGETQLSPDVPSTRPLLDKLGVKPGAKIAIVHLGDPGFVSLLRQRTSDIVKGRPAAPCDLVFFGVEKVGDLKRLDELKTWIEPNGAIWVIRPKGAGSPFRDTDVIDAGAAAGLVDNKIASFSPTHGGMRLVFRLRDRPPEPRLRGLSAARRRGDK
jgi:hypothetical protein